MATGPLPVHRSTSPLAVEITRPTLTSSPTPGGRLLVLDCPHGTTEAAILTPDDREPGDFALLFADALLRARHEEAERCGCAAGVRLEARS